MLHWYCASTSLVVYFYDAGATLGLGWDCTAGARLVPRWYSFGIGLVRYCYYIGTVLLLLLQSHRTALVQIWYQDCTGAAST